MSSTSGRSSRSTLIETNPPFKASAIRRFSKDSRSMTWHQWQVEYPIERKTGFSSALARAKASGPHGYQSTGLSLCWSRYGLRSPARRLDIGVVVSYQLSVSEI